MTKTIEVLTLISSVFGLFLASVAVWNVSKSILTRLAIIQNRLDSLKGMIISLRSRADDIEKYLSAKDGYRIRSANDQIETSFLRQYDEQDTGF